MPTVPDTDPVPDEDYDDYLEWTEEEEEAFLKILTDSDEENTQKE